MSSGVNRRSSCGCPARRPPGFVTVRLLPGCTPRDGRLACDPRHATRCATGFEHLFWTDARLPLNVTAVTGGSLADKEVAVRTTAGGHEPQERSAPCRHRTGS